MASSSSTVIPQLHHYNTIKLTNSNYLLWQTQLLPILRSNNLYGLVDGTESCPPAEITVPGTTTRTPNPDYKHWVDRDQFVLSWINTSLSEAVLPIVVGHNTSASAWRAISDAFCASSHTHILQLLMQLHNTKRDDKPVATYLQELKYLADQLGDAGKLLSPPEFNAIVFNNIGSDVYPAIAALSSRPTLVSYPELLSVLTSEEIRLRAMQPTVQLPSAQLAQRDTNPSANFPRNGNSYHTNGGNLSRNGTSHPNNHNSSANSFSNRNRHNFGTGSPSNPRCQICRQNGHYANRKNVKVPFAPLPIQ
ncbi:hypothetical protein RJ640_027098 [Escallonia rubra]|uniref:Retrotransposon Copia-like N-terminal domain-containing protein n=1 Tax=Escallonia rubra TaxID=112253 RepID=A0AA88S439_9ASTE|nr:hypothetical protein RJ640_027098 [Escallonia rubra]